MWPFDQSHGLMVPGIIILVRVVTIGIVSRVNRSAMFLRNIAQEQAAPDPNLR